VSLDSVDDEVFRKMAGEIAARACSKASPRRRAGSPIKLNCVVERGVNDHTVVGLARRFRGTGHIVRFIEYMDVGTRNAWDLAKVVPAREIVSRIDAELPLEPAEANYPGEVARRWRYADGQGEIGVISSVTQPFCGDCTRARLSAEGSLVTCLFATSGRDLKKPLRDGASDDGSGASSRACGAVATIATPNARSRRADRRSDVSDQLRPPTGSRVLEVARAVADAGGRALLVSGCGATTCAASRPPTGHGSLRARAPELERVLALRYRDRDRPRLRRAAGEGARGRLRAAATRLEVRRRTPGLRGAASGSTSRPHRGAAT
jgi:hypothetical protein